MPSRVNQLKGTKKPPLPSNRGRSRTKTKKISNEEIKEYMKKKIHNILRFGGNMNRTKIIDQLVEEGYKNNTKLQNSVRYCVKELIKDKKIKVEGKGVVFVSKYGKILPSKLRKGMTANNLTKESQERLGNF
jgi:hypothetical protein